MLSTSEARDLVLKLILEYRYGAASAAVASGLLYLLYRNLLPKPIPGIPYNEAAAKSLLGDLPEVIDMMKRGEHMHSLLLRQPVRHNSVITQFFLTPLGRPVVILADFRESLDIMLRRSKEFDRGGRITDIFVPLIPEFHIAMKTSDPRFKTNKELIRDLMAPNFLNNVTGPLIHEKLELLTQLWSLKADAAAGRPFEAAFDLSNAVTDAMNTAAYALGNDIGALNQQMDYLKTISPLNPVPQPDGTVAFPIAKRSRIFEAFEYLTHHTSRMYKSSFPTLTHWYCAFTDMKLPKFAGTLDKFIKDRFRTAMEKLQNGEPANSAIDEILKREKALAERTGRPPNFRSKTIHSELVGYFFAGQESSAASIQWVVKMIADYQDVQKQLRSVLHSAFPRAKSEGRQPTAEEIIKTSIPYLDGTIEELFRLHPAFMLTAREAVVDTTILGYPIPKGTSVILPTTGLGYNQPCNIEVPEKFRSETSRTKGEVPSWDSSTIHLCRPERWIRTDPNGEKVFDSKMGPMLAFGGGHRACFGRRLAYLELRLTLTLLVWNFHFHKLADNLSSYQSQDGMTSNPVQCNVRLSKLT